MRINGIKSAQSAFKFGFKSRRTDINTITQLKNGTNPISENLKLNILGAVKNLAKMPDRANIEFLMDISENLNYGQGENTEFKAALDKDGITPEERENTNWQKLLNDTISRALDHCTEDVEDLRAKFVKSYGGGYKSPLTQEQKEVLDLRMHLADKLAQEAENADDEDIIRITNIRKNLDYFTASSEISINQKKECLERFNYFLSDDYKIHPQLTDKKLQALDEMLSDIVIKTPEDDVLTIKAVNQLQSGICAAISICRKAIAYEDKTRYVDIILDELKDSPTMEVYDVTELGTGKKTEIEKADINYDAALSRGYRIIDASAHIWMQNAHASGDGSILTERYTAFDDDYYGIYDDSSWYEGIAENLTPDKEFLKALIKERAEVEAVEKKRKEMKSLQESLAQEKSKWLEIQEKTSAKLNDVLSYIFPEKNSAQINELRRKLIKYYTGTNSENEINVAEKLPKELKQQKLEDFIRNYHGTLTEDQEARLKEKSAFIYNMTDEYTSIDKKLGNAKKYSSQSGKFRYYKNLFRLAAAHRHALETDIQRIGVAARYEKALNIPPNEIRVIQYLHSIENKLSVEKYRSSLAAKLGIPESEISTQLAEDIVQFESIIPLKLNALIEEIFDFDLKEMLIQTYEETLEAVKKGDKNVISETANLLGIKPDNEELITRLNQSIAKLKNTKSINSYEMQDSIREIGHENIVEFVNLIFGIYRELIENGISEKHYKELQAKYGKNGVSAGLTKNKDEYVKLRNQYYEILNKWQVPTRREAIIDASERQHWILSLSQLDKLKERFDIIDAQIMENRKTIPNIRMRKKSNNAAIKFNSEEIDILNKIESQISSMRRYSKNSYKEISAMLHDELENLYSYIGRLNGQFWVREEGSSGLSSNEQLRIIEQMTGKPYHIETDVKEAAKLIKSGQCSGIISSSVDDTDYAFHAQYIPMITSERFKDTKTGKTKKEDVLWTDNSWGKAENEYYWTGVSGKRYTDYGGGYGWRDGFIVDKNYRIGQKVSDIDCAVGTAENGKTKFGLLIDMIIPGNTDRAYTKISRLMDYIFKINDTDADLDFLEQELTSHPFNPDDIDRLDDLISMRADVIANKLEKIKTKDEYDKLPDNDPLKLTMEKMALYTQTYNEEMRDIILSSICLKDLKYAKAELIDYNIDRIENIISKSPRTFINIAVYSKAQLFELFKEIEEKYGEKKGKSDCNEILYKIFNVPTDENAEWKGSLNQLEEILKRNARENALLSFTNEKAAEYFAQKAGEIISNAINQFVRIKSVEDIKTEGNAFTSLPLFKEFIAAVDKYLKPRDDNELLKLIQELQNGDFEVSDNFIKLLKPEDIGLKFESGYEYIKKYKADDMSVIRNFSKIAGMDVLYSDELNEVSNVYRALRISLLDMDVQKFIKSYKAEAFEKYKVRQAFPQPVIMSDESVEYYIRDIFSSMEKPLSYIFNANEMFSTISKFKKFKHAAERSNVFKTLIQGNDVKITEQNKTNYENALSLLQELYEEIKNDKFVEDAKIHIELILEEINNSNGELSGEKIGSALNKIYQIFEDYINTGILEEARKNKIDAMQNICDNVGLFVNSAIDMRYRNDAMRMIKNIINASKKMSDEEKEKSISKLIKFVQEHHITRNPVKLLNEVTKDILAGRMNTDEYTLKKMYLNKALKVANQTRIQYKLVQNQHEGFSSKLKGRLSEFCVYDSPDDYTDRSPMASEDGLIYLIQQLENADDNHTTLTLFMEQTGLAKNALSALINTFNIKKCIEQIDKTSSLLNLALEETEQLRKIVEDYFEKSEIKYKSLDDACNHIADYVERKIKFDENSPIVKPFIEMMRDMKVSQGTIDVNNINFSKQLLPAIVLETLNDVISKIGVQYDILSGINDMIIKRVNLIMNLKVPENSPENEARSEFMQKIDDLQIYLENVISEIDARLQQDIYDVN